jgi:hypothetical protein
MNKVSRSSRLQACFTLNHQLSTTCRDAVSRRRINSQPSTFLRTSATLSVHPGGVPTALAKNMPKELHANLADEPDLAAGFAVWLCSGKADWAKGRYLSCNWDVDELTQLKDQLIGRRFPAASITQAFSIRRLCASGCLAESIQLIKSLRSIGVRSLH